MSSDYLGPDKYIYLQYICTVTPIEIGCMVTGVPWVPHLSDLQLQHSLCEAELLVRLDVLAALLPQRHCVLLDVAHLQEHTAWGCMIWGGSYDVNTDQIC